MNRRKVRRDIVCAATQDEYQTVAEALQAAVISLLEDEDMKTYKKSFHYWAAFITHGFASIKLDDALLDQIHERLQEYQEKSSDGNSRDDDSTSYVSLARAMLTRTRDAYHRLEKREETLSRQRCAKWGVH